VKLAGVFVPTVTLASGSAIDAVKVPLPSMTMENEADID
jgi:hypothetical protein